MDNAFQSRIDLFLQNAEAVRKGFMWKNTHIKHLAALMFTAENRPIDIEALRSCEAMIKECTGAFSTFRGNSALTIAAMMALKPDPQALIEKAVDIYGRMKRAGFRASDYLTIASFLIAEYAGSDAWAKMQVEPPTGAIYWAGDQTIDWIGPIVAKTKDYFDGMRDGHALITGQDDYIMAAMLAPSGPPDGTGGKRGRRYFAEMKPDANEYPGALPHMLKAGSLVFTRPKHAVDTRDWSQWWNFKFGANWRRPYGPRSSISGVDDHPVVHLWHMWFIP